MAEYTFFTNPMSRGQIARWALHEAGADYAQILVDWEAKPDAFTAANPMGKVPTIVHHHGGHDHAVSEAAAICHYLAETHPDARLLPDSHERAAYYRWLFFAAGPVEQAVARSMGWDVPEGKGGMVGFGSFEKTMEVFSGHFEAHDFVCGSRFTMADVYVGSQIDWGLAFGSIPETPSFAAYAERLRARPKYAEAKAIDMDLIQQAQKH
ncbi:MAG: glutathione S-transferase family protein [Pontixanthobacter sp.]